MIRMRTTADLSLGPTLDFLRLLWELDHALQRRSKRMTRELRLTGPQRLVLTIVGRFPGLPAGDLAALLHLHPSTLTGILARLEQRGWITRRSDARDRRRALFGLSASGHEFDAAHPGEVEAAVRRVLAGMSTRDLELARRLLRAITAELRSEADVPPTRARRSRGPTAARDTGTPTRG